MAILAASTGQIVAIALGVLAAIGVASWWLKRRRSDVWQQLARGRGLTFVDDSAGPHISGDIDGRPVEVHTDQTSSDHDVGGVAVVQLAVALDGVPTEMSAEGVPGLIGDLATLVEGRIELADESFDRDVLVQGDDTQRIRTYWQEDRRSTFLRLIEQAPCDQVSITDGSLVAELRDIVSDRNRLERLLDLLLAAAPTLDGSATPTKD